MVTEEAINKSCRLILEAKYKLGPFEDPVFNNQWQDCRGAMICDEPGIVSHFLSFLAT